MGEHKGFDEPSYQVTIYTVHGTEDSLYSVICRMKGSVHGKADRVAFQVISQVVSSVKFKCQKRKNKSVRN